MSDLSTTADFQQRMFERMREDMGKLMTDEDLKKLLEASMHKAFFERRVTKDHHNYTTMDKEPVIVELVREAIKPAVEARVAAYVSAHPEITQKLIDDCIQQGFANIVITWFNQRVSWPMQQMAMEMERALGMPPR